MYSYRDQLDIIKAIRITDGDRKTIDCPFCGGRKKFTIDKYDGKIVWNCYKASCNAKGAYSGKRSIEASKAYLAKVANQRKKPVITSVPTILTKIDNHLPAIEYIKSVNSWEAYVAGDIKLSYAPAENRVLFHNQAGTGAVGRSLGPARSKWWAYGELPEGIAVGKGTHAVLVEDAPSACSVSGLENVVGVALLGTNITSSIKKTLNKYKKVTLVLDKDASTKAVLLIRKNSTVTNLRLTTEDLKCMSEKQIQKILL